MDETKRLLARQAAWQETRRRLSWPDKIRTAEAVRETLLKFRRSRPPATAPVGKSKPQPR